MLVSIFVSVLNMSLVASYVTLFVLIVRLLIQKAPKIFSYALWAVVLVRLLCPFSFESAIGLLPSNTEIVSSSQDFTNDTAILELPTIEVPAGRVEYSPESGVTVSVDTVIPIEFILGMFWVIGIAVMVVYSIVSLIKLRRKLIGATPFEKNIYIADHIDAPFVMGFIKPKIYLPSNLTDAERDFIITHEQTHIGRLDHITRILSFMALAVHWFNPLVWIAFVLSGKDMEISCDESVMKKMNTDIRADYCEALLKFATGRKLIHATPLAFGEGDTKGRVKNVMKYKRPVVWVSAICLILVSVIAVSLMSNSSNGVTNAGNIKPTTGMITEIDRENHLMKVEPLDNNSALTSNITLYVENTTFINGGTEKSIEDFSVGYTVDVYVNTTNILDETAYPLMITMGGTIAEVADTSNELLQFEMLSKGTPKEEIRENFGEPDIITQVTLGDIYYLNGYQVAIYYDLSNELDEIMITPNLTIDDNFEFVIGGGQSFTPKVTTPILWTEDSVGDVIILDYADDEKIVFHGYFGLFVYDLMKENITLAVDLNQAVGTNILQGTEPVNVVVDGDGKNIMLWNNAMRTDKDLLATMYIDITSGDYEVKEYEAFYESSASNQSDSPHFSGETISELKYTLDDREYLLFDGFKLP